LDSPFWRFSLSVYASPGVRKECIELQDNFGVDVNLLLFTAFIGAVHGALLSRDEISDAMCLVGQWQGGVVRRLRETRHTIKDLLPQLAMQETLVTDFRDKIKSIELEAERIEQAALEAWLSSHIHFWQRAEPRAAVMSNIRTLFALCGEQQIAMPTNVLAAVAQVPRLPTGG
jgi:uncharacterized protein (TIGR02444 family)